ncbi:TLC domain-containing protein 2-like isoform X2 [Paramacrobiotus metropolitanus]|uniref:TLC domain-containing protein 2-like isoform X2 n=1 Tax=Paramacrobiotus metropolitanus TaxID=2943436 RepID=UPI002445E78D|nr:TLC domain-containing protein 2-like isoform X2 [Paramacrobiotus metropolitanus]
MALSIKDGSSCNAFFWILNGFLGFALVNNIVKRIQPESVRASEKTSWRWCNTATSLVHGTVSGIWCLTCAWLTPEIIADLVQPYSSFSQAAVAVSVGYFVYDFVDIATHKPNRKSLEMMLHHVVTLLDKR